MSIEFANKESMTDEMEHAAKVTKENTRNIFLMGVDLFKENLSKNFELNGQCQLETFHKFVAKLL